MTFTMVYDHVPAYAGSLDRRLAKVVTKVALDVQGNMQTRVPVDTGFLKNSIQASKITPLRWRVTVGADYGVYQEYGTVNMRAHPFFHRSVEAARQPFLAAAQAALGQL